MRFRGGRILVNGVAVSAAALSLVRRAGGSMRLADLGNDLGTMFPGEGKLIHRLGYRTFSELFGHIPELEFEDFGTERRVREAQN